MAGMRGPRYYRGWSGARGQGEAGDEAAHLLARVRCQV